MSDPGQPDTGRMDPASIQPRHRAADVRTGRYRRRRARRRRRPARGTVRARAAAVGRERTGVPGHRASLPRAGRPLRHRAPTQRALGLPADLDQDGWQDVVDNLARAVESPIIVVFGDRFPMITAHKVLAAYACLAPRIVTGQFDPTHHRAIWPSTGNYCRGGVAISRIMGCRGVAVLPAGMSRERFAWLERWVADPGDIIRTPGTESNVKEIYDECAVLDRDPGTVIFNQFSEFANHVAHYTITGRALERVYEHVAAGRGTPGRGVGRAARRGVEAGARGLPRRREAHRRRRLHVRRGRAVRPEGLHDPRDHRARCH